MGGVREGRSAPRTWALLGDKAGDNAQVAAVAERLPWPVETRRLVLADRWTTGKPPFRAALYHVDSERSDALEPPWPDLALTIGRRPAMAALWVQERSGGRTRVVLFGPPKRWMHRFALVVVPCQYRLPRAPNVMPIGLPLMRVDERRLAEAREAWRSRLAALPRPLIGVLVGGSTKPFVLDAAGARALVGLAARYREPGGSLFVTTSRRTSPEAAASIAASLPERAELYRWTPGATDNPYLGLLAHADGFVVTGDSVSMLTEVARLARPLAIHALPERGGWPRWLAGALSAASRALAAGPSGGTLARLGLHASGRDLTRVHRWLFERGLAVPAGVAFPARAARPVDEVEAVVERIVALAGPAPADGGR